MAGVVVTLALAWAVTRAALAAEPAPAAVQLRATRPPAAPRGIDGRVQLLARELDLDARQQAAVRDILLQQRYDVQRVWGNESVSPALRVAAVRGISDRAAERIRSILNDQQRERYIKPRPAVPPPAAGADVDAWMRSIGGNWRPADHGAQSRGRAEAVR